MRWSPRSRGWSWSIVQPGRGHRSEEDPRLRPQWRPSSPSGSPSVLPRALVTVWVKEAWSRARRASRLDSPLSPETIRTPQRQQRTGARRRLCSLGVLANPSGLQRCRERVSGAILLACRLAGRTAEDGQSPSSARNNGVMGDQWSKTGSRATYSSDRESAAHQVTRCGPSSRKVETTSRARRPLPCNPCPGPGDPCLDRSIGELKWPTTRRGSRGPLPYDSRIREFVGV